MRGQRRRSSGRSGHAVLPQLREERGRPRAVREYAQRAQRIFWSKREHGAKRVGIDTHPTEFVQQDLERVLVCQPHLAKRSTRSDSSDHYKQIALKSYTTIVPT
jgi:hypothetical protein